MATMTISTVRVHDMPRPFADGGVLTRRVLLDDDIAAYTKRFGGPLPQTDTFGYEMAYFVGAPILSYNDAHELCVDVDDTGEVVLRELTGTVLCGDCASKTPDFAYYVAYQINGEVGDCDRVFCEDCGRIIYHGGSCES